MVRYNFVKVLTDRKKSGRIWTIGIEEFNSIKRSLNRTRFKAQVVKQLVYCITDISPNNLYKFSSAALSSIDDATASPHSSALQIENSFCVILLKVNDTVH